MVRTEAPDRAPDLGVLERLRTRLGPVTLAREHLLEAPEPLLPLVGGHGLQRGHSVGFDGPGSWSVALALAATAAGADGWTAVVGVEELGLVAASELGVRLDRLLLVESMPSTQLAEVLAVLVETVDVVMVDPRRPVGHRDARRLSARSREQGSVLFHLDGGRTWPLALDLTLTVVDQRWEGLGRGHGLLRQRRLTVEASGRRSAAGRRRTTVLLPGPGGKLAALDLPTTLDLPTDREVEPGLRAAG
ncbi:MAG: hypothetical protein ACFCVK_22220 [Acidimicrobiales bacterium]